MNTRTAPTLHRRPDELVSVDSALARRRHWLEFIQTACEVLTHEPEWLIASITVCSGLGVQKPADVASMLRSARRIAQRYDVVLSEQTEDHHVSVRLTRAQAADDGVPHSPCHAENGHVAIRWQPAAQATVQGCAAEQPGKVSK